ncbi:MAG: hypothetical protein AAFR98_12005 [Pseudomonadota bacterium]
MKVFSIKLMGALCLTGPDGDVRTPRLAKTQALLAFLVLAEGKSVNRAKLQNLLWSDRSPSQGRNSLRKAISDLKKCFQWAGDNPLKTDGGPVAIDLTFIEVDLFDNPSSRAQSLYRPEFLEGIDIYDDEFNSWLQAVRMDLAPDDELQAQGKTPAEAIRANPSKHKPMFELGFLPLSGCGNGFGARVGDMLIAELSELCLQSAIVRPFDFRSNAPNYENTNGPDVFLSLQVVKVAGALNFAFNFHHTPTSRVIFCPTLTLEVDDFSINWLRRTSNEVFDQLCEKLAKFDGFSLDLHVAAKKVYFAIDRIFRLTKHDLDVAGAALDEASEQTQSGSVLGWNAFLTAFRLEKEGNHDRAALMERAEELAQRALEKDNNNPLIAALVGHVYGFVLNDRQRAADLLHLFSDRAHRNHMLADTIAMHCYYSGDYAQARKHAVQAVQLGRLNPFRYSFTTSLAMTNLMCGNTQRSIQNCQTALTQHLVRGGYMYEPTLRTLAAAAGHEGERELGLWAYRRLSEQSGSDPLEVMKQSAVRFPNTEALETIKLGMEKIFD